MQIIRVFVCAVLFAIAGCSSDGAANDDHMAEQSSALSCSSPTCIGAVSNGTTSLPSENQYFCHPTFMLGAQAHSQSPIMTWGIPAWGGQVGLSASASSPSMAAIPNQPHQGSPRQGLMTLEVQCDKWTNFTPGAGNGYSPEFAKTLNWQGTLTPVPVSDSQLLWDINSVCYLSSLHSLSRTGENAILDVPNNWNWRLNVQGWKGYSATSRCAWLGHVPNWNAVAWLSATPGNPANSGKSVSGHICLVYRVDGDLDSGHWYLNRNTGNWVLEVGGGVSMAQAYCIPY